MINVNEAHLRKAMQQSYARLSMHSCGSLFHRSGSSCNLKAISSDKHPCHAAV